MDGKKCFKCGEFKTMDHFYAHPQMGDGYLNKCKECAKADVSARYRANRRRISEYERKRNSQPERRKKRLKYQARMRLLHPEKRAARAAVGNALRDGRIQRQACNVCGDANTEAHHDDYSKPLEVQWLCFKHHREIAHGQTVIEA